MLGHGRGREGPMALDAPGAGPWESVSLSSSVSAASLGDARVFSASSSAPPSVSTSIAASGQASVPGSSVASSVPSGAPSAATSGGASPAKAHFGAPGTRSSLTLDSGDASPRAFANRPLGPVLAKRAFGASFARASPSLGASSPLVASSSLRGVRPPESLGASSPLAAEPISFSLAPPIGPSAFASEPNANSAPSACTSAWASALVPAAERQSAAQDSRNTAPATPTLGALSPARRRMRRLVACARGAGARSSDAGPPESRPYVLMGYMQAAFNAALILGMLWALGAFALTVRRDVEIKVRERLAARSAEIAECARHYAENRCEPESRVPAMHAACAAWEACVARDPSVVGRAKLSAETLAEIVNGLVEPVSYKTLLFLLAALFGTIFLSNYAFTMARGRAAAAALALVAEQQRALDVRLERLGSRASLLAAGALPSADGTPTCARRP